MKKEEWVEPTIGEYYDEEDKELIEGMEEVINRDDYVPSESLMTPEYMDMLQRAAARALERKRKVTPHH